MTSNVIVVRWMGLTLPVGIEKLVDGAQREGYRHLTRLRDEWDAGKHFDGVGECLFVAWAGPELVGTAGISRDPYVSDPSVGRLRNVHVDLSHRRMGIASELARRCLTKTGSGFALIRLRATNPAAQRVYERLGFRPIEAVDATHALTPAIR